MLEVMDGFLSESEVRLRALTSNLGHLFARPEPRELFHTLVEGMLSNLERKNGWTLAQRAGHIIKKGDRSVGVAPHYCGATNSTENCRVTVLMTYAGARCRQAGIPVGVGFATKLDLAVQLLAEAIEAEVPFGWVAMDGGYGQYTQDPHLV